VACESETEVQLKGLWGLKYKVALAIRMTGCCVIYKLTFMVDVLVFPIGILCSPLHLYWGLE